MGQAPRRHSYLDQIRMYRAAVVTIQKMTVYRTDLMLKERAIEITGQGFNNTPTIHTTFPVLALFQVDQL